MTAPELITYQTAEAYGRYIGTQYAQDLTDVDEAPEYWPPAFQRAFSKGFDAAINEFGEVEVVINLMSGKERDKND